MLTLVISLLVPLSLVLIFKFLNAPRKPPIFGVYQQRNKTYWLKFIVLYLFLRSRQLIIHLRRIRAVDAGRSDDGTITIHEQDEPLEKKYNLGDYPLVNESHKLRKQGYNLDRQIRAIQREEDKIKRSLKEAAKKNDKQVCAILETEIIRSRKAISELYTSKAHLNSAQMQMKNQLASLRVAGSLQKLTKAVDAVYFNGMSKEGAALVCGVARRAQHNVDAFIYLKAEGEELLLAPSLPDTRSIQTPVEQGLYRSGGLTINNYIPMRTWEVTYNGEMKTKGDVTKKVELNVAWSAHFGHFNYDNDMAPLSMASDMAREPWSADYFRLLKKYHQTHYEQMGHLLGTVTIDGVTKDISMPCVRDHSFGNYREWRTFHRYVLHFLFLENGDCLAVGCVSQPVILSHLSIGYLCRKADQAIFPVKSTDFKLYHHGENGDMPKDYGFSFKAGGEMYVVEVAVTDEATFYLGQDREAKIFERWCNVQVNGVKGWGCAEWQYNNTRK